MNFFFRIFKYFVSPINLLIIISSILSDVFSLEQGFINVEIITGDRCFTPSFSNLFQCQIDFQKSVQSATGERPNDLNLTSISDDFNKMKTVCCQIWSMFNCARSSVSKWSQCETQEKVIFMQDLENLARHGQDMKLCAKHGLEEGSLKCGFPIWAAITLSILGVVIMTCLICILIKLCLTRRENNEQEMGLIHEIQTQED